MSCSAWLAILWTFTGNTDNLRHNMNSFDILTACYMIEGDAWNGGNAMPTSTLFDESIPQTFAQWISRGRRLQQEQQFTDALSAYEQAILCNPKDASAYEYLAHVCYQLGKYDYALAGYQRALELNPTSLSLHCSKGEVLEHLERYEEALCVYEQALVLAPQDAALHALKAFVLTDLRREREALAAYAQALLIRPDYAEVYNNLGLLLAGMQHDEQAIRAFQQAVELQPDEVLFYRNLSALLESLGRWQEAVHLQLRAEARGLLWGEPLDPETPNPEERVLFWENLATLRYPMPHLLRDMEEEPINAVSR
jgi:tetratricopeptide (TPR) repeat protein